MTGSGRMTKWMMVSAAFPLLSSLAACATSDVCEGHAFLRKYDCSLSRVEGMARSNDPSAEYALGYMYYYGIGAPKNLPEAKSWMRLAAAGHPKAIEALRLLEASGNETPATVIPSTTPAPAPAAEEAATPAHAAPEGSYGIQVTASTTSAGLNEYSLSHDLKGKADGYKVCIDGKVWYILIYGHFANESSATRALRNLPAPLKDHRPFIKSYRTITQQVAKGRSC